MNEIFPDLHMVSTSNAAAGSLVRLPRSDGSLLALVTDQSMNEAARSLVILNATLRNRPPIVFFENWRNVDSCLSYKTSLHFDVSTIDRDIDAQHNWWRTSGVLVCVGDQLYLQVAPSDIMSGGMRHINVRNGVLLDKAIPNDTWFFGVWGIWLKDTSPERRRLLFEFNVHEQTERQ